MNDRELFAGMMQRKMPQKMHRYVGAIATAFTILSLASPQIGYCEQPPPSPPEQPSQALLDDLSSSDQKPIVAQGICGVVLDQHGNGVFSSIIAIDENGSYAAATDRNGRYCLMLAPGSYSVAAFYNGHEIDVTSDVDVVEGGVKTHNVKMLKTQQSKCYFRSYRRSDADRTATLSLSLRSLQASQSPSGPLRFNDTTLADVTGYLHVKGTFGVLLSSTMVAKQSAERRERVMQAARLQGLWGREDKVAVSAGVDGGATWGTAGHWVAARSHAVHRFWLTDAFALYVRAGGAALRVRPARAAVGEVQFGFAAEKVSRGSELRMWLSATASLPVWHDDDIDPLRRLDIAVGITKQLTHHWSVMTRLAIVDGGSAMRERSVLPVLDRGFDQLSIGVSLTRTFSPPYASRRGELAATRLWP